MLSFGCNIVPNIYTIKHNLSIAFILNLKYALLYTIVDVPRFCLSLHTSYYNYIAATTTP